MKHFFKHQNKFFIKAMFLCLVVLLMTGCDNAGEEIKDNTDQDNATLIYYVNKDETKIVGQAYEPINKTKEELVAEYLDALGTEPKDITLKQAKPEGITVEKYSFNDNDLSLYFNSAYTSLSGILEVLSRASIVKTLCQIEGIDTVEFYVGNKPLTGLNDKRMLMKADDFIDDTSAENVFVTVYFANLEGDGLVASNLKIPNHENVSIEKLILERLIAGPLQASLGDMQKTLPDGTDLIKVTTKDGICYVDFNDKFLDKVPGVDSSVVLYSVVDSLVELSTINKVQFTINGSTKKTYQEDTPFDGFFERNLDLINEDK